MNKLKINAQNFFLTYPRWTGSEVLESVRDQIKERFLLIGGQIDKYVLALESHQDGTPHLHFYGHTVSRLRKDIEAAALDIGTNHPNIQMVRNERAVIKYCQKGNKFISSMEIEEPKVTKRDLAKKIIDGAPLGEMVLEYPQLLFGLSRLQADLQLFWSLRRRLPTLEGPCGIWIFGPPGVGKSQWAEKYLGRIYRMGDSNWFDGYTDEETIIKDDFPTFQVHSGKYDPNLFLQLADSRPCQLQVKGGIITARPLRVVVTSNHSIEETIKNYPDPYLRRFRQFYVTTREDFIDINVELKLEPYII